MMSSTKAQRSLCTLVLPQVDQSQMIVRQAINAKRAVKTGSIGVSSSPSGGHKSEEERFMLDVDCDGTRLGVPVWAELQHR